MEAGRARAFVLSQPRRLEPREFPLPAVRENDGILRVEACGLCGTDHEQYTGALPMGRPFVPGHEIVGVVERAGSQALERWGVRVGDRVAVEVFQSCRECPACRSGAYRRCERHGLRTAYGFTPLDREPSLWGGYATHLYLSPDALLLRVPETLDPVLATVFNPLGAGFRWAATVPETKPGDVVAVLGPGIRGLSAAAAAKEAGAGFVMITGIGPRDSARLEIATRFGADLAVDVTHDDPVEALREATGGGADVVVDVTANAPAALGQAVHLAKGGGTIVLAGTKGSSEAPGFSADLVIFKEVRIVGALGVDAAAYERALELLASRRFPFAELPRETVGFESLPDLLSAMAGERDDSPPVHGVLVPEG